MVDADVRGRVIMAASCVYRGDKYQLTADITGRRVRRRGPAAGRMTAEEIAVPADRAGAGEATTALRLLAVDGGQSAIRVRSSILDEEVEVEGVSRDTASDDRVAAAVESGWASLGRPTVDRAVLGMTTAPVDPAQARASPGASARRSARPRCGSATTR